MRESVNTQWNMVLEDSSLGCFQTPAQNWPHPDRGEAPLCCSETCSTFWFDLCGEGLILQRDNEPKHTSKLLHNYWRPKKTKVLTVCDITRNLKIGFTQWAQVHPRAVFWAPVVHPQHPFYSLFSLLLLVKRHNSTCPKSSWMLNSFFLQVVWSINRLSPHTNMPPPAHQYWHLLTATSCTELWLGPVTADWAVLSFTYTLLTHCAANCFVLQVVYDTILRYVFF